MSADATDPVATLENKLGALIDSLTPDELEVFGTVLADWREFGGGDEVEGFAQTTMHEHHAERARPISGLLADVVRGADKTRGSGSGAGGII